MAKFLTIPVILIAICNYNFSQESTPCNFQSPLDIPLFLSGNFGELRATHFHAGIDIKTQGEAGKPVYTACEGYISRIKIQSGGYGKSLYMTHPNGYTTVYAHLNNFLPDIEKYVRNSQYARKSFEIELYPPKGMFVFQRGELIGYSGNTGRSGGPHLHFEIRKTNGQIPVNGLKFHLPIDDKIRPEFRSLYAYSYPNEKPIAMGGTERSMYPVRKKNDSLYVVDKVIECYDNYLGFGAEVYDYLNGSSNKCGIYMLQLIIEDVPRFMFQIDAISFANSRFVNAHMDYALKIDMGKSVHRLFVLPNNTLPIYSHSIGNGLLYMADDSVYQCKIVAMDAYGNTSTLLFSCKSMVNRNIIRSPENFSTLVSWDTGGDFSAGNYSVHIPPRALYQDIYFSLNVEEREGDITTDTLIIHRETEPLHIGITVKTKIDSVMKNPGEKLLFARINGMNQLHAEGGEFHNGELTLTTRNLGKYIVTADTVAPVIKPLTFRSNGRYNENQSLVFNVEDDLSGIQSYNVFIDDEWALLEYDAKSGNLTYTIDPERLVRGKSHIFRIIVSDAKNNISEYENRFEY